MTVVSCAACTSGAAAPVAREHLAASPRPTAIVVGNDLVAIGCLEAIEDAGPSCPGDVSRAPRAPTVQPGVCASAAEDDTCERRPAGRVALALVLVERYFPAHVWDADS